MEKSQRSVSNQKSLLDPDTLVGYLYRLAGVEYLEDTDQGNDGYTGLLRAGKDYNSLESYNYNNWLDRDGIFHGFRRFLEDKGL
jgi:hypothetical protein